MVRTFFPLTRRASPSLVGLLALVPLLLAGCDQIGGASDKSASKSDAPAVPQEVFYVVPVQQTVRDFEEFTGRTSATNTVDIRARVSGYLDQIEFKDGALVEENETLIHIDDRSFKVEVNRAKAAVDQFTFRLDRMQKQVRRAANLVQTQAMTQDEYDTMLADRNETQASLDAANAALEIAELNLSYTKVEAPISGRISRRLVDAGNLVNADETVLATIVALDPIYVYFDMDERTVLKLKRLLRQGRIKSARETQVKVEIALADETEFTHVGTVNFVDNQIDAATGTLRFRAEIDNEDRFFTPGLFVRLRFPIGDPHPALLVPEESLGTDQGERFVYVVSAENEIEYRQVTTGLLINSMRVISEGVQTGERVVVTGLQRVRPGMQVTPKDRAGEMTNDQ